MSMNFFFKAFEAEQIEAMLDDNSLIDAWVLREKKFADDMDVETAWDVLKTALEGNGFDFDEEFDNVLFNGAMIARPATVARQAKILEDWTPERLIQAVQEINPESDLYHSEIWMDEENEEELIDYFCQLQDFYTRAAGENWGLVIYAA